MTRVWAPVKQAANRDFDNGLIGAPPLWDVLCFKKVQQALGGRVEARERPPRQRGPSSHPFLSALQSALAHAPVHVLRGIHALEKNALSLNVLMGRVGARESAQVMLTGSAPLSVETQRFIQGVFGAPARHASHLRTFTCASNLRIPSTCRDISTESHQIAIISYRLRAVCHLRRPVARCGKGTA